MSHPTRLPSRLALLLAFLFLPTACGDQHSPTAPPSGLAGASALHPGGPGSGFPSTIDRFMALDAGPVAIAHRGMGPNLGEDPSRPIENTVPAVRQGFETGAPVVEVDLQMTADGEIVGWHDDFLEDFTCIGSLTRRELAERAPHIDSFQAILQTAARFNRNNPDRLSGLLTVDLKPTSPHCDPEDIAERDARFVSNVVRIIRRMGATELIYFNSMSPVLLGQARDLAPEIPRQLTLIVLQFLTAEEVEAALGLPVTLVDKDPDYGLQWAEVGPVYRLPGYASVDQAIATAFATGSQFVSYDLRLLGQMEQAMPGAAAELVQASKAMGFRVLAGDVSSAQEWHFGASLGVAALYADDVPLAVSLQPPLHE